MANIQKLRHGEEKYGEAKIWEFRNLPNIDTYEIITILNNAKTTRAKWAFEDDSLGNKAIKTWLYT